MQNACMIVYRCLVITLILADESNKLLKSKWNQKKQLADFIKEFKTEE